MRTFLLLILCVVFALSQNKNEHGEKLIVANESIAKIVAYEIADYVEFKDKESLELKMDVYKNIIPHIKRFEVSIKGSTWYSFGKEKTANKISVPIKKKGSYLYGILTVYLE